PVDTDCTFTFQIEIDYEATPSETIAASAIATWTSIAGVATHERFCAESDPLNDYIQATGIEVELTTGGQSFDLTRPAVLSPPVGGFFEYVATITIPQGTSPQAVATIELPDGFLVVERKDFESSVGLSC